jgi:hypothetical protein
MTSGRPGELVKGAGVTRRRSGGRVMVEVLGVSAGNVLVREGATAKSVPPAGE